MVRAERIELPTFWFVARRSIQLSYARMRHQDRLPNGVKNSKFSAAWVPSACNRAGGLHGVAASWNHLFRRLMRSSAASEGKQKILSKRRLRFFRLSRRQPDGVFRAAS
jgi:hypothetical protein